MFEKSVYVSGAGGLGNQIHSLSAAYCVAKEAQSKIIYLLPRKKRNSSRTREEFLDSFHLEKLVECPLETVSPTGLSLLRWVGIKLKLRLMFKLNLALNLQTTTELYAFLGVYRAFTKSIHLGGHYENSEFPIRARALGFPNALTLLSPGTAYQQLQLAIGNPRRKSIIALHVRLGDFRHWQNGEFLLEPTYYRERLMLALIKFPDAEVWIFSDEPKVAASFVEDIVPVNAISENYELTNAEELCLLTFSDLIIASHGTFSWWGCFWKEDQENIYYPDPALCLPNWIDNNLVKH
jgi:hypothetical protein